MADKQNLAKESQLVLKQDKLIAGANITIALDGKTISAANPTSVTVTPVYQAGTLVAAIIVNGNTTNIYAPAQHGDNANQNLALSFSAAQTYEVGDFVIYQEDLYKCITAIDTPAAWDSTKWMRTLITDEMGQGSGGDYANQNIANTYDITSTYDVGDYVIYAGLLYKCITAVETPGPFNINYWTQTIIVDEMGSGGGLDLPNNWTWDEEALTAFGYAEKNEYGWGVVDDTFYVDEQISFTTSGRTWTRDNDYPTFLAYVNHNGWNGTISVSTNADATHFSLGSWHNNQDYGPYEYDGYNWYLSGMEYSDTYTGSTLPYLGSYNYTSAEGSFDAMCLQMITDIMTRSQLNGMTDQFVSIMQPGSGTLIAGGGEESDLSDATFKVTSDGGVYGTEFYKNGVPIGGGGGNVDDVYVNGTSVLDSNKIAQITNYVELTQAEYDALPASKLTDNILYCIKDKATADTTVAPIIYSEEEREVGVWTDGKPLYQKTISFGALPTGVEKTVAHNISNIDHVVSCTAIAKNPTNGISLQISYVNSGTDRVGAFVTDTNVGIVSSTNLSAYTETYITIQYTKTTDTPGSGKYAPSGVPAVHYSTNEQIIGTWVDGSTVYEKTFEFSSQLVLSANNWTNSSATVTGINNILDIVGYDGTAAFRLLGARPSNDIIQLFATLIIGISKITIRYTKTTS